MNENKSSIDFTFSLGVICSIIKGSLSTGVLSLGEENNCFKLAKFTNRGKHEKLLLGVWLIVPAIHLFPAKGSNMS